jgi:hypothetical protein
MKLICQKWEESERGYGTRPDGYSLHRSRAALHEYIQEYNDKLPPEPPDEYSRPCGEPYECELADDDPKIQVMRGAFWGTPDIVNNDVDNIRVFVNDWPEPSDGSKPTGWMHLSDGGMGRVPSALDEAIYRALKLFEGQKATEETKAQMVVAALDAVRAYQDDHLQTFAVDGLKVEELYLASLQAVEEHAHLLPDEFRAVILKRLALYFIVHAEGVRLVKPVSEERLEKLKASHPLIEKRLPKRLLFLDDLVEAAVGSLGVREEPQRRNTGADIDRLMQDTGVAGVVSAHGAQVSEKIGQHMDALHADLADRVVDIQRLRSSRPVDPDAQPSSKLSSRTWEVQISQVAPDKDQQRLFCERLRKVADDIESIPPYVFAAFYAQPGGATGGMCGAPAVFPDGDPPSYDPSKFDFGYKGVWSTKEDDE